LNMQASNLGTNRPASAEGRQIAAKMEVTLLEPP